MSADISRFRFDPLRHYAGVVLQQGRLLLDADFNELVEVLDRRLRAEACDVASFGPDPNVAGTAWVPRQTPDGFEIALAGGGLTIGRGRMYVDGILAENHGAGAAAFDAVLAEATGSAPTPYDEQPYRRTTEAVPKTGTFLAYLDVWRREVTHVQEPDLVEVAVGVDATARTQTAWQVRLQPVPAGTTCSTDDDDIPGWPELIRPSDGRLTTGTVEVDDEDDPCELPPTGGYRGLENQTYRIEIHEGGAPGAATFKWSRENASVVLPVVEMVSTTTTTTLRLASIGKDDVLRVSTGDWVEILDDAYELDGRPGELRRVTVDDAERTIAFTGALPADLQPASAADAAERHLRARRWDHDTATGTIVVPASDTTQVVLEHGVAVSFDVAAAGGRFRRGDHWIFAARTADASVEELADAPPRGIHHHYARLAVVNLASGAVADCRRLWPPLQAQGGEGCDCTVCVTPESHSSGSLTVQAAIDSVRETGGTVCLAAGTYDIANGVEVDGARSVRIRGQGPATILVARGQALSVTGSIAVTVESLAVVSGVAAPAAIRLRNVALADLHDLAVLSFGSDDAGGTGIELSGVALLVGLRRNVVVARTAIGVPGGAEELGVFAAALRVEDNTLVAPERGIDLGGASGYLYDCRVTGNDVLGPGEAGIVATGIVAPGGSLEVSGNRIACRGDGIVVGADAAVEANTVNTLGGAENRAAGGDGIVVDAGRFAAPPGHVRIVGNRVHDRTGGGIVLRTSVRTWMVKQNVVANAGYGIAVEGRGQAERLAVENNEVLDVTGGEGPAGFGVGILVANATSAAVAGNTVVGTGAEVTDGDLGGIVVLACEDVRVSGNIVDGVGAEEGGFAAVGIAVVGPFERASVSDNSSRFRAERAAPTDGRWHALLIQSAGAERTRVARTAAVLPLADGRAVVLNREWAFAARGGGDHAGLATNTLSGGGREPACLVRVGGDVVAEGNRCFYTGSERPEAIVLAGGTVIASSNRVRGGDAMLLIVTQEDSLAAVGNLAPDGTHLGGPGAGLPSPWQPLNPRV